MRYLGRSNDSSRPVIHLPLGRAAFDGVLRLQRDLQRRRAEGRIDDVVITVEHDPVFTVGRRGSITNLLVDRERLVEEGIDLVDVERGGDITYHGPGQLVVYPILDLHAYGRDLRAHVERLEEAAIRTAASFGIDARRAPGRPGVWVDGRKIASVGVHVRRWVTMHGLALNVDVDRRHFAMIRPCGLPVETVSMAEVAERPIEFDEVVRRYLAEATALFGWVLRTLHRKELKGA